MDLVQSCVAQQFPCRRGGIFSCHLFAEVAVSSPQLGKSIPVDNPALCIFWNRDYIGSRASRRDRAAQTHRWFSSEPVGAAWSSSDLPFPGAGLEILPCSALRPWDSRRAGGSAAWSSPLESFSVTRFKLGASPRLVCVYTRAGARAGQPGNHSQWEQQSWKLQALLCSP